MPSIAEAFENCRQQLEMGDTAAAWSALRAVLDHPSPLEANSDWTRALELLADVSKGFGASKLEAQARAAAAQSSNPDSLYDAAFELYEQQLHGAAASLLARANA